MNTTTTCEAADAHMRLWEAAEISRSRIEAHSKRDTALCLTPRTIARYAAPLATTAYPLEYAYHALGAVAGRRVIDFGCGTGSNTVLLAQRSAHVCGIDISESLVQMGRDRLAMHDVPGRASLIVGSAHDLPFQTSSVDAVFGIAILHHLDLETVAAEVYRVLKPGGRAIFEEPVRNSPVIRALRRLIPHRAPNISPFERPLTDRELTAFARRFTSLRARAFGLPHVKLGRLVPLVRRRLGWLYALDRWLLDRVPPLRRYAGIRVIVLVK